MGGALFFPFLMEEKSGGALFFPFLIDRGVPRGVLKHPHQIEESKLYSVIEQLAREEATHTSKATHTLR